MATSSPGNDIATRVIDLLAGLHGPDDIAPERIQQATGLTVRYDPEDRNRYGVGARIDDRWNCSLTSIPDRARGTPRRMVFSYDRQSPATLAGDPDVPAVAPEFDAFAGALREAGYAQSTIPGPRGAIWGHRFVRGDVELEVNTEREDPAARDIRFRVSRVTVDTGATEVGHG